MYQYLKRKDGYAYYKVGNLPMKNRIIRICNNKITYPDKIDTSVLVKCKEQEWNQIENTFSANRYEEWLYKGKWYRTAGALSMSISGAAFDCRNVFKNPDNNVYDDYLVYHRGLVWATYFSGNYIPRIHLSRVDAKGINRSKWTDLKYCQNIEEFNPHG